jgi:hypothetical protein
MRDRIVIAGHHLGESVRRAEHPDRIEYPLPQRDGVGVTEVSRRAAVGHRRRETAGRHHLIAVLKLLAERRGQGEPRHAIDHEFGGERLGVEHELEVAPGEAGAGTEGITDCQSRREIRVGDGEGRQQIDQQHLPAQPPGVDEGGRQQRAERLGDRADAQQGVGRHRRWSSQLADAEPLQEDDLAALDDGDGDTGEVGLGQVRRNVGLERRQPLAGQRQRRHTGQVGERASLGGPWSGRRPSGECLDLGCGELHGRSGPQGGRRQPGCDAAQGRAA